MDDGGNHVSVLLLVGIDELPVGALRALSLAVFLLRQLIAHRPLAVVLPEEDEETRRLQAEEVSERDLFWNLFLHRLSP